MVGERRRVDPVPLPPIGVRIGRLELDTGRGQRKWAIGRQVDTHPREAPLCREAPRGQGQLVLGVADDAPGDCGELADASRSIGQPVQQHRKQRAQDGHPVHLP
jgi:hypothetical protein